MKGRNHAGPKQAGASKDVAATSSAGAGGAGASAWGNSDTLATTEGLGAAEEESWLLADEEASSGQAGASDADGLADEINQDFLSATNPDAGLTPREHPPEVLRALEGAVAGLGDAMGTLVELRSKGWDFAELAVAPEPVPNRVRDLVPVLVGLAVASATAGIGGVVGAAAAGAVASAPAKEFVKSAVKDTVDGALNEYVDPLVQNAVSNLGDGALLDVVPAFFRAPSEAMLMAGALVREDLRNDARRQGLLASADPVGDIRTVTEKVRGQQASARSIQQAHAVAAWMRLLARGACGPVSEGDAAAHADRMAGPSGEFGVGGDDAGTDLRRGHDGGPLSEPTPGVVRLQVVGMSNGGVRILSADAAGTSPAAVRDLRAPAGPSGGVEAPEAPARDELTVGDLGLLVRVEGTFSVPERHGQLPGPAGRALLGENEGGVLFLEARDAAPLIWLASYPEPPAHMDTPPDLAAAREGARRFLKDHVWNQTPRSLGIQHG